MIKTFTAEQLLAQFAGKYIDVYPHYDYATQTQRYEVRGTSKTIKENFDEPFRALTEDDQRKWVNENVPF